MNLNDPEIQKVIFGVIGAVGTALITGLGFILKSVFLDKRRKFNKLEKDVEGLKEKQGVEYRKFYELLVGFRDEIKSSYDQLKDAINANEKKHIQDHAKLTTQVETVGNQLNHYAESVSELKGRVDDQLNLVSSHISTIGHMSRQIDALFRAVDADKRATDVKTAKQG